MQTINNVRNKSYLIVFILLFFLVDEVAFILYNISFFQFMCANTFSLFFTDEIPSYISISSLGNINLFNTYVTSSFYSYLDASSILANLPGIDVHFYMNSSDSILDLSSTSNELQTTYYKIKLEATNVKKNISSFYPLQQYIYTIPGESSLIFYRLENKTDFSLQTLSVYVTTPAEAVAYIKKLQCFCYEELMVAPNSVIDLPILFSIDEEILNEEFKEITLNYILLLK